jgi:outer membrane protein assembly factor BamB
MRQIDVLSTTGRKRRRWPLVLLVLVLVGGLAGGVGYLIWGRAPGDVSNPDAEFTVPEKTPPKPKPRSKEFVWPIFGYTPDRAKYFPAKLDPPFKKLWRYRADSLLEFPPVLADDTLFLVTNKGTAVAVNAKTGKKRWKRSVGSLSAASPAWWKGRLFVVTLDGRATSLRAKDGKVLWRKDIPSRTESSPFVRRGRVYFGSEDGTVYALRAGDGKTVWTYRAGGAVKSALAFADGKLYFGDYAGAATAIRARDGERVWSSGTAGLSLGRSGRFYSTPAVAFGRVYMGNTDGRVYSFTAHGGELAWSKSTGAYVYSGPAAADVKGRGPTVFIGSYTGRFYALDARSGSERWSYQSAGRISGAVSVIGRVVYFGNLGSRDTEGLDVRTGKRVFRWTHGGFAPPISDGKTLWVTGYASQFAFAPRGAASASRSERRARGKRRGRGDGRARKRSE